MKLKLLLLALLALFTSCDQKSNNEQNNSLSSDSAKMESMEENTESSEKSKKDSPINPILKSLPIKISNAPKFIHDRYSSYLTDMVMTADTMVLGYVSQNEIDRCGAVFLKEQDFGGDDVPFLCYVSKNIKSFYLNGKKIHFIPEKEFFFRQRIELFIGYNRIPIRIVNQRNEKTEDYLEINMVRSN